MKTRFHAHLHREGVGLEETKRLLRAWAEHGNMDELKRQAYGDNLLGKQSDARIKALLGGFRRRFLRNRGLPPARMVALALESLPEIAFQQVLFPYFLRGDLLVERCYRDLVLPRWEGGSLSVDEVTEHLKALSRRHPELRSWSSTLCLRWAQGFLALLRRFHLMKSAPSKTLQRLWLSPEAFAFFWLWFWKKDGSLRAVAKRGFWPLLGVGERDQAELLHEGASRGWWFYQRAGEIVSFQPRYDLEGWLKDGVARGHHRA